MFTAVKGFTNYSSTCSRFGNKCSNIGIARTTRQRSFHLQPHASNRSNKPISVFRMTTHNNGLEHSCFMMESNGSNNSKSSNNSRSTPPSARYMSTHSNNSIQISTDLDNYDDITKKTKAWIQNVVIGLNLCPFAEKALSRSEISTHVVRGNNKEEILCEIIYQSMIRKEEMSGTALIICPDFSTNDFTEFLDLLEIAQTNLEKYKLVNDIQIAPFHPLFEFDGSGKEGVDNWTNRSPYPIFHILREEEVSLAVKKIGGDSSKIWQRNVTLLKKIEKELGRETIEMIMKGDEKEKQLECVKSILNEMKLGH